MSLYPRKSKPVQEAKTKVCAICEARKPVKSFYRIKATGYLHSYCRPCHGAYLVARYRVLKKS